MMCGVTRLMPSLSSTLGAELSLPRDIFSKFRTVRNVRRCRCWLSSTADQRVWPGDASLLAAGPTRMRISFSAPSARRTRQNWLTGDRRSSWRRARRLLLAADARHRRNRRTHAEHPPAPAHPPEHPPAPAHPPEHPPAPAHPPEHPPAPAHPPEHPPAPAHPPEHPAPAPRQEPAQAKPSEHRPCQRVER